MQVASNASTLVDGWLEAGRGLDTVLVTAADERWTADDLYRAVCNVAAHLADAGIGREDRVLMVLDDTPAFPATFLGAMRIGAVPVPVNFLARPDDFGYFLNDSCAVAAVIDHGFLEVVAPQVVARPGVRLIVANGTTPEGADSLDDWMAADGGDIPPVDTHPDDMAFWLYSSGSTGPPKGVVHRHADIAATCTMYAEPVLGIGRGDVAFSSTKMFHAYGLGNNLSFPLWAGATSVYLTGRPTPDRLLERIRTHRPSLLFSVPSLYNAMLAEPGFDDVDWSVVRRRSLQRSRSRRRSGAGFSSGRASRSSTGSARRSCSTSTARIEPVPCSRGRRACRSTVTRSRSVTSMVSSARPAGQARCG